MRSPLQFRGSAGWGSSWKGPGCTSPRAAGQLTRGVAVLAALWPAWASQSGLMGPSEAGGSACSNNAVGSNFAAESSRWGS